MLKKKTFSIVIGAALALSANLYADEDASAASSVNFWPVYTRDQDSVNVLGMTHDLVPDKQKPKSLAEKPAAKTLAASDAAVPAEQEDPMHFIGLFPLYTKVWNSEENYLISFPLFWYGNNPESKYLNVLGPVYHYYHDNKAQTSYNTVVWPLCEYEFDRQGKVDGWHFWPLVSCNNPWLSVANINPAGFSVLGPLLVESKNKGANRNLQVVLLYNQEKMVGDSHCLPRGIEYNPLNNRVKMPRKSREEQNLSIFPLWFSNSQAWAIWKPGVDQKKLGETVAALDSVEQCCQCCGKVNCKKRWHRHRPSDQDKQDATVKLLKLLPELQIVPELNQDKSPNIPAIRTQLAEKYTTVVPYHHYFALPVFYDYQSLGNDYSWSTLLFITGGRHYKETYNFHIMEYLYRYDREGEVRSQFVFPFIMTEAGPERRSFSFLWRVYERIVEKDKVSGHFMFIPF